MFVRVHVCVYYRNILAEGQGGIYGLRWIETQQWQHADVVLWNLLVKRKEEEEELVQTNNLSQLQRVKNTCRETRCRVTGSQDNML